MTRTTLLDVAKKARVSKKTVSRVLNDEPNVSPKTLEKVQKAIAALNYVPHSAARSLSSGKAMALALVVGWPVTNPYSSALVHHTLKASNHQGYNLALFSIEDGFTRKIVDAFLGRQVDGVILDTNAAEDEGLLSQLDALNVPHLVVNPNRKRSLSKTSYVQIEDRQGAKQAIEYLIQLGHRSIGCITTSQYLHHDRDRAAGYREAMAEAGLPLRPEWEFEQPGLAFQSGFDGTLNILTKDKHVSAIFAGTDEVALGSLGAIWSLGMRIPEDVSVVGFDDIAYASMIVPPLTTVHQPIEEIAAVAVKHLIASVEEPAMPPIDVVLPTRLVIRKSCAARRDTD
jgi:DNA-binding LacI/PurR family transcriptional regulator